MDQPVAINILGQSLLLKSPQGEESIHQIAASLEKKIDEMGRIAGTANSMKLLLFVALSLTDENLKLKREMNNLEETVESESNRMLDMIDV